MSSAKDLQGVQEDLQESWLYRRSIQDRALHILGSHGYRLLEVPILAPADLFLRKSGGELASQMFSFVDPGSNSLSLRPEFTAPIMLHYLDNAQQERTPVRWQYAGPVFRYGDAAGRFRGQFTQIGAELIGAAGVLADAELVILAADVLSGLGITDYRVRLADLEVLHSLLDTAGISDRARSFIIAAMPSLRQGTQDSATLLEQAQHLHLTGSGPEDHHLNAAIVGLDDAQAKEVLRGFMTWSGGESPQLGQRDPEEVVERLLRKLRGSDDRERLEQGFNLVSQLVKIRGLPTPAIEQARKLLRQAGADLEALDRFESLVELLQGQLASPESLVADFGLARGIGYYNGIIFEVDHPDSPGSLGGGGRYDALARALGGPGPVPSLGFAYNMDALVGLVPGDHTDGGGGIIGLMQWPDSALVVAESDTGYRYALEAARGLRKEGVQVMLGVSGLELSDSLEYAAHNSLSQVVVVHSDGQRTVHPAG